MSLKSKKRNSQLDWLNAFEEQRSFAKTSEGRERAEALISLALSRIPEGKCVYGWSAGKDAQVINVICERAGIKDCVLSTLGLQWEYPSFLDYLEDHSPEGLVIKDWNISSEYLNQHDKFLFPSNSKESYRWYLMHQEAWRWFLKEKDADHILLGHRTIDGNNLGGRDGKVYPIADFSHEDVFLIMAYAGKVLPDQYYYPRGFHEGSGPWIKRTGGAELAMSELMAIDENILLKHMELNKVADFVRRYNDGSS